MEAIKSEGFKLTTPLIICNTDDYSTITPDAQGHISVGDKIIKIN